MSENASTATATPSSGGESVVKTNMNNMISFDELGALESAGVPEHMKADVKAAKKDAKDKKEHKKEAKEAKEKEDDDRLGSDGESDTEDNVSKETKERKGEQDEQEESKEKSEKVKSIKIRAGEQEYEIPSNAPVPVKINGKDENVSFQELVNNYSGKVSYEKKFNELAINRKKFENERNDIQSSIDNLTKVFESGDARYAFSSMVEALGGNGDEWWGKLVKQVEDYAGQIAELTPEQREALKAKQDAEFYKKRIDLDKRDKQVTTQLSELKSRVETVKNDLGIEHDEFEKAYKELRGFIDKGDLKFSDLDKEFTPEFIGDYIKATKLQDNLNKIVVESVAEDKQSVAFKALSKIWQEDPSLTAEDIKDIAKDVYGQAKPKASRLADKVQNKQVMSRAKDPRSEPLTFDDL